MEDLAFRVSLTSGGEADEDGLRSFRITFKPYLKRVYKLTKGDVLNIIVIGIYEDEKAIEYETTDFQLYGKVILVGGKSLGMTVEKKVVRRRNLKEKNELEIKIKVLTRAKEESEND